MEQLSLRFEFQENPVVDEVSAMIAVVRPILQGLLYGLKREIVNEAGGVKDLKLFMLARLRKAGDGDVGICFEYAVHDALMAGNPMVCERVSDALSMCNVPGEGIGSILFGAEKNGALSLISTAKDLLTEESLLLYGQQGRPAKLKSYIDFLAAAFRKPMLREYLPGSFNGLWMADLFTGRQDTDRWVGTSLKINRDSLKGAKGLRIGIVPAQQGESDRVKKDDGRNLVICPLPYDRSFMQVFYQAWELVLQFLDAQARVPAEVRLPRPAARQVARYLEDRREFRVLDVIDALGPLAQPHLLRTQEQVVANTSVAGRVATTTTALMAPIPRLTR